VHAGLPGFRSAWTRNFRGISAGSHSKRARDRAGPEDRDLHGLPKGARFVLPLAARQPESTYLTVCRPLAFREDRFIQLPFREPQLRLEGTRCRELGGGWSTQSFSETFGWASELTSQMLRKRGSVETSCVREVQTPPKQTRARSGDASESGRGESVSPKERNPPLVVPSN
jgi:hypothetical protein